MKTFPFRTLLLLLLSPLCAFAGTATIKIDVDRVIAQVDPRIYGVFMEPIGFNRPALHFNNTLYGPVYDWRDGIGPKDQRPKRRDRVGHTTATKVAGGDMSE